MTQSRRTEGDTKQLCDPAGKLVDAVLHEKAGISVEIPAS